MIMMMIIIIMSSLNGGIGADTTKNELGRSSDGILHVFYGSAAEPAQIDRSIDRLVPVLVDGGEK